MRRSAERLGGDPWNMRTWCSDISPGWSTTSTARASSTSTMISCPRESRLPGAKVSRCATCSVWVPAIMRIAPLVIELSEKATHAVTTSGSLGRVLVPGHEGRIAGLLDEEARAPAEQVRAEDVLDRVQDARVADQLVEPGEEQMALVPELAAQRAAPLALDRLEPRAIAGRLLGREHAEGEVEPVTAVLRHGFGGEGLQADGSICGGGLSSGLPPLPPRGGERVGWGGG